MSDHGSKQRALSSLHAGHKHAREDGWVNKRSEEEKRLRMGQKEKGWKVKAMDVHLGRHDIVAVASHRCSVLRCCLLRLLPVFLSIASHSLSARLCSQLPIDKLAATTSPAANLLFALDPAFCAANSPTLRLFTDAILPTRCTLRSVSALSNLFLTCILWRKLSGMYRMSRRRRKEGRTTHKR